MKQNEFNELISKAQSGEKNANDQLIIDNMPLVYSLVKRYKKKDESGYDDLVQQGCLGLMQAISRFDISRGVMFSTYAVPLILGEIRKVMREDNLLKVGRVTKESAAKLFHEIETLEYALGRSPTINEISNTMDISSEKAVFLLNSAYHVRSIDEEIKEGGDTYADTIKSDEDTEMEAVQNVMLTKVISFADNRQKKILYLRYYKDKTQCEVADMLGISQVQVSRIEKQILKKLRTLLTG